jgi:hypothetical protein
MTVPSQQDATMTGQIPGRTSTHIFLHFASGEEFRGSTYRLKKTNSNALWSCNPELQRPLVGAPPLDPSGERLRQSQRIVGRGVTSRMPSGQV